MNEEIGVLDRGYVKLVEAWGSDKRIIESARMSTDKGFLGWGPMHGKDCPRRDWAMGPDRARVCDCNEPGDEKLLAYLYNHNHTTPFEMAGATFEIQAPIFVFREWHRHRTQSYNEMSARYIPLPDINYKPSMERVMMTSATNRQAQGITELNPFDVNGWLADLQHYYDTIQSFYEESLRKGIPKELARIILPVGRYSKMRASANLLNWIRFCRLRMPENAQWEIRQYANALSSILENQFPRTWHLFLTEMDKNGQ